MKFYSFARKLPDLGTNVIVISDEPETSIGICEVTAESLWIMKCIAKDPSSASLEYYPLDFYSDDCMHNGSEALQTASYWCYPSTLKVKPKKREKYERETPQSARKTWASPSR